MFLKLCLSALTLGVVFRCVAGGADAAFPGAAAEGAGQLGGHQAGDHEPADPPKTSLRHHQCPGGNQPPREAVDQQVQVDVSALMKRFNTCMNLKMYKTCTKSV